MTTVARATPTAAPDRCAKCGIERNEIRSASGITIVACGLASKLAPIINADYGCTWVSPADAERGREVET